MNLSCLQENLSKGLGIVGRAVAQRTTLPITQNVLLATDGGRLKLSATNLEIAITCWIGADVEEEGATTVPSRLLSDFVNSLPPDKVAIKLPAGARALELACGRSQARISGMNADDFPPIPKLIEGISTSVSAQDLRAAISQVSFSAATEEARPVLTGVQCEFEGDRLTLVAADGFRLAVRRLTVSQAIKEKVAAIIPARALNELSRMATDEDDTVQIMINTQRGQVLFKLKNIEMVSQLIQGTFPNYSQLIPQSYTTKAIVGVSDFARATKMASIFARDGSGIVRLIATPADAALGGKITVKASAEEVGENTNEIEASIEGQESKIAFNSRYLTDVLNVVKQAQVSLETNTPSSPGVIRPVGDDSYIYVVMPMFVQW